MAFPYIPPSKIASFLSLSVALLLPFRALGEEAAAPPEQHQPENVLNALDSPRDYLSGKFVGMVSNIDRFFGDNRHYQETNDSVLQLDLTRTMGYNGENRFVLSGRAKIHLPDTEQRLHLLIETDPEKNAAADSSQTQVPATTPSGSPGSVGAGLRFERSREERWHFSADAGIKFQGFQSSPFARTRASLFVPMELWRANVAETLFWFNTSGIGENSHLDLERPISEPLLFRASSNATWLKNTLNFDLRQDLSLFHTLDERTALLYQASALGVSQPQTHVTEYIVQMLYRYRLHRDWTFLELSPQLHFPKEKNFQSSPALTVRLEILFDKAK